jgi:hypothetical protein
VLEGGTLTSSMPATARAPSTAFSWFRPGGAWRGGSGAAGVVDTLLGPEGTPAAHHREVVGGATSTGGGHLRVVVSPSGRPAPHQTVRLRFRSPLVGCVVGVG